MRLIAEKSRNLDILVIFRVAVTKTAVQCSIIHGQRYECCRVVHVFSGAVRAARGVPPRPSSKLERLGTRLVLCVLSSPHVA